MSRIWMRKTIRLGLSLVAFGLAATALAQPEVPLANWTVPGSSPGVGKAVDATSPRPFIGLQPCRLLDTRGAPIGGGIFANSEARNYTFPGSCGIPPLLGSNAIALSLNFTVTGSPSAPPGAFILAWPQGGAPPPVSILNFQAGQTIANAAIVPTSSAGGITINVSHGTHVIVDVNGYYSDTPGTSQNYFQIDNNSTSASIATRNASTICIQGCGMTALISSASGGWAITGIASGTTGENYGVFGNASSNTGNSAGVLGVDRAGRPNTSFPLNTAGVRGESDTNVGVLGVGGPTGVGTDGIIVNAAGAILTEGILGYAVGGTNYAVYGNGNFGGTGAKYFVEPHPQRPEMVIRYISLEGREAGTYFRGKGRFQNGLATIEVPEDFRMVTDTEGLSIQVTPIGELATVAVLRMGLDRIVVKGSRNVEFYYTVNGVRKTHKDLEPVGRGDEYMPRSADATMPEYLTAGQKAMLVSNGTYKEDGTVNLETAKRVGWDKIWAEKQKPIAP